MFALLLLMFVLVDVVRGSDAKLSRPATMVVYDGSDVNARAQDMIR